jgi:hypothetical protein
MMSGSVVVLLLLLINHYKIPIFQHLHELAVASSICPFS